MVRNRWQWGGLDWEDMTQEQRDAVQQQYRDANNAVQQFSTATYDFNSPPDFHDGELIYFCRVSDIDHEHAVNTINMPFVITDGEDVTILGRLVEVVPGIHQGRRGDWDKYGYVCIKAIRGEIVPLDLEPRRD